MSLGDHGHPAKGPTTRRMKAGSGLSWCPFALESAVDVLPGLRREHEIRFWGQEKCRHPFFLRKVLAPGL